MNKTHIFHALLVLCCMFQTAAIPLRAATLPDSLVTGDNVYRFMFTDISKAEAIMAALREKGKMPEWELDYTEGDLCYNTGRNYQALKFYSRALDSQKAEDDDRLQMDLVHRMISCYDMTHNEIRKAEYVRRLLRKAEECGDKAMQAVALFNMGKSEYNQGDKSGGYKRMEQAARMMAATDYEYKYDNLRYHYNTLLTYYVHDKRGTDALRVLDKLEKIVTASTGKEKTGIDGLDEKEQKAFYGHRAVVMNLLGRNDEADECYRKFSSLGKPADRDQYIAMPYLFERKMYSEILRISRLCEQRFKEQGDTVNYHFTTVRKNLARAYFETGNYKEAAFNFELLAVLRDSIKAREQQSAALELAEAYDSAEKDRTIIKEKAQKAVLLALAIAVSVAAVTIVTVVILYNRKIRLRNRALVRTVIEGQEAKNRLMDKHTELQELRTGLEQRIKEQELEIEKLKKIPYANPQQHVQTIAASNPKEMEDAICAIGSRKLFLDPDVSVKSVQERLNVDAGRLVEYMEKEKGVKFFEYINELRVGYAVTIFTEHPDFTIEAVSKICGFNSRQYFGRCFTKHYGVSPIEFKKTRI